MTLFSLVDSGMVGTLIVIYLGGWWPVTLAAYAAGKRLRDPHAPAKYPVMVSLVAGALWPLLVVGLIELSSARVFTDAGQHHNWHRRLRVAAAADQGWCGMAALSTRGW